MSIRASFLILFFVSTGAVFVAYGQASASSAESQIAELRSNWCKYLHAKQLDPEMDLYAEDAVFLQPTGERITGLPAIRKLFVEVMAAVTSEPLLTSVDLEVSGMLAYDSGTYQETLTNVSTRAKTEVHGSFLMVLKRQNDGKWRIQQQMWSQSP